jgi:hypothetical protein
MILRHSEFDQTALHNHDGNGPCPQCAAEHAAAMPAVLQFQVGELRRQLADAQTRIREQNEQLYDLRIRKLQLERLIVVLSRYLDRSGESGDSMRTH